MTFCVKCGIEIPHAASNQKYCRECAKNKKKKRKFIEVNARVIKDSVNAKFLSMSYGEYSQFKRNIHDIVVIRNNKLYDDKVTEVKEALERCKKK